MNSPHPIRCAVIISPHIANDATNQWWSMVCVLNTLPFGVAPVEIARPPNAVTQGSLCADPLSADIVKDGMSTRNHLAHGGFGTIPTERGINHDPDPQPSPINCAGGDRPATLPVGQ